MPAAEGAKGATGGKGDAGPRARTGARPLATTPADDACDDARLQALYGKLAEEDARAATTPAPVPGEPFLRRVEVHPGDAQDLFDLHVKLEFSESAAVVDQALNEVARGLRDYPVEYFVQNRALVDNCVAVAQACAGTETAAAALGCVRAFVRALAAAVHAVHDPRYVGAPEDAARPGAAAPDAGAFFREADAPGRRQYFPPDAADIVPVIPCVHLVLAAALGLLGDRPELGLVVEIVRDCAGFLDFEYDPREKAEQLRLYLAAASKALAGVAPDSWLALTRADAGPDRANVALSAAQGAVVRVAALLVARVAPGQVPELVPADLGAFLRSCFCDGFVTHCVPSLAADLRPFMEARYPEELQAVLASRDALRLLKAVAESTDSLKSAALKTLPQIRALADRMAETLDVIAYTRDADGAAACVDACFGVMRYAAAKAHDDLSAFDADAAALLGPIVEKALACPKPGVHAAACRSVALNVKALDEFFAAASPAYAAGTLKVLCTEGTVGALGARALHEPATAGDAVDVLVALAQVELPQLRELLSRHHAWFLAARGDAGMGPAVSGLLAACEKHRERAESRWLRCEHDVRNLYHGSAAARADGVRGLCDKLVQWGVEIPYPVDAAGDPLRLVMETAEALPGLTQNIHNFVPKDARKIEGIFLAGGVETEIRKSAAEQLTQLLHSPELRDYLGLDAVVACCVVELREALDTDLFAGGSQSPNFVCACLGLLRTAFALDPRAAGAVGADDLVPLLPLLFNPYMAVQRAAATLFLAFAFPAGAYAARGDGAVVFEAPARLLEVFAFPVATAPSPPPTDDGAQSTTELVQHMLEQHRTLLEGTDAALARLQGGESTSFGASGRAAAAASLTNLDPATQASRLLEGLAGARNHAECEAALQALDLALRASGEALRAELCGRDWLRALHRLLGHRPRSPHDYRLWERLFPILSFLLRSGGVSDSALVALAVALKEHAAPLLKPESMAPLRSLADVTAEALGDADSPQGRAHGFKVSRLFVSQRVLDALGALLACCRARSEAALLERVVSVVVTEDLVAHLADQIVAAEELDYASRCGAIDFLHEVVQAVVDHATLGKVGGAETTVLHTAWVSRLIPKLVNSVCIAKRPAGEKTVSLRGRHLLVQALKIVRSVMESVPAHFWGASWATVPGTFWLSKLCREADCRVWEHAHKIAALLLRHTTAGGLEIVTTSWPDCVRQMAATATDRAECYAVRAAALSCVAAALHADIAAPGPEAPFRVHEFVEQYGLWEVVEDVLLNPAAACCMMTSCMQYLLTVARVDGGAAIAKCFEGRKWQRLLEVLADACVAQAGGADPDLGVQSYCMMAYASELLSEVVHREDAAEGLRDASACVATLLAVFRSRVKVGLDAELARQGPATTRHMLYYNDSLQKIAVAVNQILCRGGGAELSEAAAAALKEFCATIPNVLMSGRFSLEMKVATCSLLSSVYGLEPLAGTLEAHDAEIGPRVLLALHPLYAAVALAPAAGPHGPRQPHSAVVAALRSVLAHSASAKAKALELGLPALLVGACEDFLALLLLRDLQGKKAREGEAEGAEGYHEAQRIVWTLTVAKHLAYRSAECAEALCAAGALAAVRKVLAGAARNTTVLHEACGLLCNLLAAHHGARLEFVGMASGVSTPTAACLFEDLARVLQAKDVDEATFGAVVGALRPLAATFVTRGVLLKSPLPALGFRALKAQSKRPARAAGGKGRALLALFTDLAAFEDAQTFFFKTPALAEMLDVLYDLVEGPNKDGSGGALAADALFFLRNLAFSAHRDSKAHFTANPRTLGVLCDAVDRGLRSPRLAVLASSALWALLYNGQKVKALMRRAGDDGDDGYAGRLAQSRLALELVWRRGKGEEGLGEALRNLNAVLGLLGELGGDENAAPAANCC